MKQNFFLMLAVMMLPLALFAGGVPDDNDHEEEPFDEAEVYVELNDTDGDLGIHASIDGGPYKKLEISTPDDHEILQLRAKSALRHQGVTQLFFESAEPTFDELTPAEFFARFPEGIYEVEGTGLEKEEYESETFFSHVLAAPPDNVLVSGVPLSDDCDESVPGVSPPIVISWDPVMSSHPEIGKAGDVEIAAYQLVVEREEPELLVYSVDLPPDVTSMSVPSGFIALGDEFKYEIIVRTSTHNNTAVESCFAVE
ncbi:MAG: hypothetical protein HKO55_04450 [Gammaproteobacteria bacterium]|nr:hypothetical protein [Gammaproteobacteria bacterium]